MKKKVQLYRFVSLFMSLCVLFGWNTSFFAADTTTNNSEYLETHYQVNLKDVDVYLVDNEDIIIKMEEDSSFWTQNHIENEVALLDDAIKRSSDMKEGLINDLQSEKDLMAVSITEAPIAFVDDHYERVSISEKGTYSTRPSYLSGDTVNREENFYLYTSVKRSGSQTASGNYTYTTTTRGYWETNSITGGSKYPGAGEDYVLQSTPSGWVRNGSSMSAIYDTYPTTGTSGTDYWPCSGGEYYIKYAILDDPSGWRQNTDFTLTCTTTAPSSSNARMINSYYIHTWDSVSISVSVSGSTDKSVTLDITPSINSKSWELYSYVTFYF